MGAGRGTVMSYSPAAVQTPTTPTQNSWETAGLAVLLVVAVALLALIVGRTLDDRRTVGGATTARTSLQVVQPRPLAVSDAGGAIHHRGGNQP